MNEYTFKVTSGKINLTDPCYDEDTTCGAYQVPAVNGTWCVSVAQKDGRVSGFSAHVEESYWNYESPMTADFGVDSGQFGIFDCEIYDGKADYDSPGFYRDCCDLTCGDDQCGVVNDRGFVTSSGHGDGSYVGSASYADGLMKSFTMFFIEDEEDDLDNFGEEYDDGYAELCLADELEESGDYE